MKNFILVILVYLLLMSPGFYFLGDDAETPIQPTVIPDATGDYAIQGTDVSFTSVISNSYTGGTESIQDQVGAMLSGNTETNITATYQDSDGTIDLSVTAFNITCTGSYCGMVETVTAGTLLAYGQMIVMSGTDGKAETSDQDFLGRAEGDVLIVVDSSIAENATGLALAWGSVTKASWDWTGRTPLFIAATPSAATTLVCTGTGTTVRKIGYGDGDTIYLKPDGTVLVN